jgi:hypothetical protein
MHEAITALLFLPFFASHNCNKVLNVLIKKFFSYFSPTAPHKEPTTHERLFKVSKLN